MTEPHVPATPPPADAAARRGRLQFGALRGLMRSEMRGRTDVAAALPAARTAARFAAAEGWATGPLWQAVGADLLLARWALDNGVPVEQIRAQVRDAAGSGAPAAGSPTPGTAATPGNTATPGTTATPVAPATAARPSPTEPAPVRPAPAEPAPARPTPPGPAGTSRPAPAAGRERPFG